MNPHFLMRLLTMFQQLSGEFGGSVPTVRVNNVILEDYRRYLARMGWKEPEGVPVQDMEAEGVMVSW